MKRINYFLKKIILAKQKNVLKEKLILFVFNKTQQYFIIPVFYFFKTRSKLNNLNVDDTSGFKDHRNKIEFKSMRSNTKL